MNLGSPIRAAELLLAGALACLPTTAQSFPKMMTFPSGLRVKILNVLELEAKSAETGRIFRNLEMGYETNLTLDDTTALQKEINEIWAWLRKDAEHRQLTDASIYVVEAAKDGSQQKANGVRFSFRRMADGSWVASKSPQRVTSYPF